jgi:energy-coupling factor transporter transmembrane protein EcfT
MVVLLKQKITLICDILLIILTVGLIPLNLFVIKFPEWVALIAVALVIAVNVFYFAKFKAKAAAKFFLPFTSIVAAVLVLIGSYCNPYWNSTLLRSDGYSAAYDSVISYEQAKSDIDYMMNCLKKCHPLFFSGIPDDVQERYDAALKKLQSEDKITVNELHREIQSIISVMKDGHTAAFMQSDDDLYLKAIAKHKSADDKLVKINGLTLSELIAQNDELYSYEVESWGIHQLSNDL